MADFFVSTGEKVRGTFARLIETVASEYEASGQ